MKRIEFEEGTDLQSVVRALFYDENDPRSPTFQRKLVRPEISWLRILLCWLLPLGLAAVLGLGLFHMGASNWICLGIPLMLCLGWWILRMRRFLICLVRIYQRYAPDRVRNKCRFQPSCSEYMIQALETYGVVQGLRLGKKRLQRCKPGDGGYDPFGNQ